MDLHRLNYNKKNYIYWNIFVIIIFNEEENNKVLDTRVFPHYFYKNGYPSFPNPNNP